MRPPRPAGAAVSAAEPRHRLPLVLGADPRAIERAAALIRSGELVAFPTETVYGLGANALDPLAVARVFAVKERPRFDPLIVHLADAAELERYVVAADARDPRVGRLARRFWPGPLTVVLGRRSVIPGIVTAGLDTVAIRVPDHPVARELIRTAGMPIAAPSANRFGRLSPTRAEHVVRQLDGRIALVLDGGPSRIGLESTVVLLAGGRAALLRPGGLPRKRSRPRSGRWSGSPTPRRRRRPWPPDGSGATTRPARRLELSDAGRPVHAQPGERLGLLAADEAGRASAEAIGGPFAAVEVLARDGDPVTAASRLFDALHRLAEAGLDRIVAQPVPETGLGRAIMDRLRRAALAP